jgi:hypothetical protein
MSCQQSLLWLRPGRLANCAPALLAIGITREQVAAAKVAAEQERQTEKAEKARQARLLAIARRGEGVWREVESEIERRNAGAYDKAASLLMDLRAVAEERGAMPDFEKRLCAIRDRHARKERFHRPASEDIGHS